MDNNFELLSVGDASLDTFIEPTESQTMCKLDTKDCLICFSFGDKIPVKSLNFSIGGNAANNAVGASRLGIKTAIVLTLGDDNIGNQIVQTLEKEKVDRTYVFQQTQTSSNYSTVVNYQSERTIFVYHAPRSYEYPVQLPTVPWVYLTSMGESFRPFYKHMAEWLAKNPTVKLAFNPGSWQLRADPKDIAEIMKISQIIFVNREEAQNLTGITASANNEKELLTALNKLGCKVPIITDGGQGAFALENGKFYKTGILPVDAYERTGAGDAFGSGCLGALIKGKPLTEALLWGMVNSSSVIGYIGPQRGLLHEDEIPAWLERCKSSDVKVEEF